MTVEPLKTPDDTLESLRLSIPGARKHRRAGTSSRRPEGRWPTTVTNLDQMGGLAAHRGTCYESSWCGSLSPPATRPASSDTQSLPKRAAVDAECVVLYSQNGRQSAITQISPAKFMEEVNKTRL